MSARPRTLAVVALVCAVALAGCGGGNKKTIPGSSATSLIRLLKTARAQAGDPKRCPKLQQTVSQIQIQVQSLPASVDKDTRDSLTNGVNNLVDDARQDCQQAQTTPTDTTPTTNTQTQTTPTQTTPTQTTPTQTTPTQTTPTQTTPTQTTPTQTQPGNGGAGPGKGNGNGNGGNAPGQDKQGKSHGKKEHGG